MLTIKPLILAVLAEACGGARNPSTRDLLNAARLNAAREALQRGRNSRGRDLPAAAAGQEADQVHGQQRRIQVSRWSKRLILFTYRCLGICHKIGILVIVRIARLTSRKSAKRRQTELLCACAELEVAATDFVAATSFDGPRPGFSFKAGPNGTGYYRDDNMSAASAPDQPIGPSQIGPSQPDVQTETIGEQAFSLDRSAHAARPRAAWPVAR